jgi:hypothetical protein
MQQRSYKVQQLGENINARAIQHEVLVILPKKDAVRGVSNAVVISVEPIQNASPRSRRSINNKAA